jgi:hypothetical protein
MNNTTLQIKLKQRLNKLASNDYDNLECWQIVEAFNKAQVDWVRRQLHGGNVYKEGDEMSKRRIDDLQILLVELSLTGAQFDDYFESNNFPVDNYLEYKRITVQATTECCPGPRPMIVYLGEEANRDLYLRDPLKDPSFEWGETFCTMIGNRIRIYRKPDFNIVNPIFTYYRQPVNIQVLGCQNPYTGTNSTIDVECEFKDDVVELLLDDTASLIAGDIENFNQYTRNQQAAERNN